MRVGIINYHCAHNFGAMCLAYALQEAVKEQGHQVKIIDFEPDVIIQGYKILGKKWYLRPKKFLRTVINYNKIKTKYDLFESFKNDYLHITDKTYTKIYKNSLKDFDAFICGSDQIWNMNINGGLTEYLLSFATDKHIKKVSYAASIGTKTIEDKYIEVFKNELGTFDAISVREDDAVRIIKDKLNLSAVQVLDPVFLLQKSKWEKLSRNSIKIDYEYVLLYGLEDNELFEKILEFIKTNYNYKIINISPIKNELKYIDLTLYGVGPREFLGLLKNAKVVFTNSFHGTCFSIIFGKKFLAIGHSELNSRLESILKLTELSKHMVNKEFKSKEEFEKIINIDQNRVNSILNVEIQKSKDFLKNALK